MDARPALSYATHGVERQPLPVFGIACMLTLGGWVFVFAVIAFANSGPRSIFPWSRAYAIALACFGIGLLCACRDLAVTRRYRVLKGISIVLVFTASLVGTLGSVAFLLDSILR